MNIFVIFQKKIEQILYVYPYSLSPYIYWHIKIIDDS